MMDSVEFGKCGAQLKDLKDISGLRTLPSDFALSNGTELVIGYHQPANEKRTTYSLLDMDLCADSSLAQPLIPLDVTSRRVRLVHLAVHLGVHQRLGGDCSWCYPCCGSDVELKTSYTHGNKNEEFQDRMAALLKGGHLRI